MYGYGMGRGVCKQRAADGSYIRKIGKASKSDMEPKEKQERETVGRRCGVQDREVVRTRRG